MIVWPELSVQPCVVGPEMLDEPGFERRGQPLRRRLGIVMRVIHDVAQRVEQALMIGLVRRVHAASPGRSAASSPA